MNIPELNAALPPRGTEMIRGGVLRIAGRRIPLLSGEIQFYRMDPGSWGPALSSLAAAGLPIVSTYLSWRRFSTGPDAYDLEGRTDPRLNVRGFLDLCKRHGLWVTMKPGPWICAEEPNGGYPDWLVEKQELHVLDAAGRTVLGYNAPFQSPIPSYLHPLYLEHTKRWIAEVDKAIADYAYPRGPIILLQLDNEPCMTFHDRMFESDYNPVNVGEGGLYGQWLQEKYTSIEKLNRAHCSAWASFTEVPAPRSLVSTAQKGLARYSDWVEFKEWLLARHVSTIGRFHRENGLDQVLFTINYNEHPQLAVPNDWHALELASGMGGFDFYPRMPMDESALTDVALSVNYSRVCNAIPWSPEIMSGKWSFKGRESVPGALTPKDFEYLYLSCMAFGLKGMNFFMFADRDNWIDSPLDDSGAAGRNMDAVRKVIRLISEAPFFEGLDRPQNAAVLYYRPHAREAFIADAATAESDADGRTLGTSYSIFKYIFTTLHRLNVDPAVADPWVQPSRLREHRMIFVPGGPCMDESTLSFLDDHVRGGGMIVWVNGRPASDLLSEPLQRQHPSLEKGIYVQIGIDDNRGGGDETLSRLLEQGGIRPEVSVNVHGIYTVVHACRERSWLFVINSTVDRAEAELHFRDSEVQRMTSLPDRHASIMLEGLRARVSCDARSVQVWELGR